jgi:glycosidase
MILFYHINSKIIVKAVVMNKKRVFSFLSCIHIVFFLYIFINASGCGLFSIVAPAAPVYAAELTPGFSIPGPALIASRQSRPFSFEDSFCETIYMPRLVLGPGEEHAIDLKLFYGRDPLFKSAEIKLSVAAAAGSLTYSGQYYIDVKRTGSKAIFKLNKPPSAFRGPVDYQIIIYDFKTSQIVKIVKGAIIAAEKNCRVSLKFPSTPELAAAANYEVYIAGDMNGWKAGATKLNYDPAQKIYYIDFDNIEKGRYKYKLVIGDKWLPDSSNPVTEPDGFGSFNSIFTAGTECAEDRLIPLGARRENNSVFLKIKYDGPSSNPSLAFFYKGMALSPSNISYDRNDKSFTARIDELKFKSVSRLKPSILFYSFSADSGGNPSSLSAEYCFYNLNGAQSSYNFRDAVIYFAMTDRFLNGDPRNDKPIRAPGLHKLCAFHGGDMEGILRAARDGYFSALNTGLLWISPVLKGPRGAFKDSLPPHLYFTNYHGYWPYSLDEAEERFAPFKKLSAAVEELRRDFSIEIILDAVLRHVTIDSPVYKNNKNLFLGLYLKDKTKNIRRFDEYPETTWFDEFLPAFDYSKKETVDYIKAKADGWIKNSGVKGFRLDAVKHIPHSFWSALLNSRDDFFTVGETIDSREKIASYIAPGMITAQFDFPLYFAIVETLAKNGGAGFNQLEHEIKKSEEIFWNQHKLTSNLIGNHDFPRFMAYADGWFDGGKNGDGRQLGFTDPPRVRDPKNYNKLKMAFGLLFALNGMPLIYYGDEYGQCGAGDPDNRRPMRFGDELNAFEKDNLKLVRRLTSIRKTSPALIEGMRLPLLCTDNYYVFAKIHFGEIIIAAFNKSDKPAVIKVNAANALAGRGLEYKSGICFNDMITFEKFAAAQNGELKIDMKPLSFRYLEILK